MIRMNTQRTATHLCFFTRVIYCLRQDGGAAVLRVGERARVWRDDECFAFDESYEHEVTYFARTADADAAVERLEAAHRAAPSSNVAVVVAATSNGNIASAAVDTVSAPPPPPPSPSDSVGVGDERRAPFRAVLIVDVANPYVAHLDAFREHAVSAAGWRRFGAQLTDTWWRFADQ